MELPERPERPEIRIGDTERDAVVDSLKVHFGAGRLNLHEFEERTAQALAARTVGELVPLTADLPAVATSPRPPAGPPVRHRNRSSVPADAWDAAWAIHGRVAVALAVVAVLLWVVSIGYLSPVLPLVVVGGSVGVHWAVRKVAHRPGGAQSAGWHGSTPPR